MRVCFAEVKTRYQAIKGCPFTPSDVAKVCGGFMCLESANGYNTWKAKSDRLSRIGLTVVFDEYTGTGFMNLKTSSHGYIRIYTQEWI